MNFKAIAKQIEAVGDEIQNRHYDLLFGDTDPDQTAPIDHLNDRDCPEASQHFLIALSLLEQAAGHMKLAAIAYKREMK